MKSFLTSFLATVFGIVSLQAQTTDSLVATDSLKAAIDFKTPKNRKEKDPSRPSVAELAVPVALIGYGVWSLESPAIQKLDYSTRDEMTEHNSFFYNKLDNYLQFSPAATAFGLNLCGVESRHKLSDMTILYALSNLIETAAVYTIKNTGTRLRPDRSAINSFPSGHTATAFVAAEFLHQEYGYRSIWYSIGGYTVAMLIGVSRIYNNRHWVSDVVAGAGIGILSTKLVYWGYPHLKKVMHRNKKGTDRLILILPGYHPGSEYVKPHFYLSLNCRF